jgi:hypothetical protein
MNWNEARIVDLPAAESSRFDRKSAQLFDFEKPKDISHLHKVLAKEIAAFANSGGGAIICGVDDQGKIDSGGIPRIAKGRETVKDWLENVIPTLTDYSVAGFTVEEVLPSDSDSSAIEAGKCLVVIEVPDSARAPHQSKIDNVYYVRLSGKSHPAPHWMLEDIRNRRHHPELHISVDLNAVRVPQEVTPGAYPIRCTLNLTIENKGKVKAARSCVQVGSTEPDFEILIILQINFGRLAAVRKAAGTWSCKARCSPACRFTGG